MPGEAVGGGELGHHEAASAEIADEATKDGIGDASHGREDGGWADFDIAERHGRWNAGARRRCALGRIVEKLGHVSILPGSKGQSHYGETEQTEKSKSKSQNPQPALA